jgi:ribonuclease HI
LFFKVVETCSQDYDNTRRGYRVVLFDLTGTSVYRPDLEELTRTKEQAEKAFWAWFNQFDELAHYRNKLNRKADKLARQIAELSTAAQIIAKEQDEKVTA